MGSYILEAAEDRGFIVCQMLLETPWDRLAGVGTYRFGSDQSRRVLIILFLYSAMCFYQLVLLEYSSSISTRLSPWPSSRVVRSCRRCLTDRYL